MQTVQRCKFYLKNVGELTKKEKEQLTPLMIDTYPKFKKYYLKNKYYSVVRPQMIHLIKDGNVIVGTGKFLWRTIKIGTISIKFFAFGRLITKAYQGKGLGGKLTEKNLKEARRRGADMLYCCTSNPIAEKTSRRLGFKQLHIPVLYKHAQSEKIKKERGRIWIYEFKKGLFEQIEKLSKLYIGIGPV